MIPRLDGLQLIHAHNRTLAVREGHMSTICANSIKTLQADTNNVSYLGFSNLEPGAYIANVNGIPLTFILYEHITGPDELIIKSRNNIFSIHNLVKHKIIPYVLNTDLEYYEYGQKLTRAVHDTLEVFVTTGYTEYTDPINIDNPGNINMTDKLYVRTMDKNNSFIYSDVNLKSPINSISDTIRDVVYVDRYLNKTLYKFNVGRLIFSGEEQWIQLDKGVFYYASTEPSAYSIVKSSHFKSIEYNDIISATSTNYGICSGPKERRGFYVKTRPEEPQELFDFKAVLRNKYEHGSSIQVLYQLAKPIFRVLPTGANIQLAFNYSYMTTCMDINNVDALSPSDIQRNKYNIYLYNHLKGDE